MTQLQAIERENVEMYELYVKRVYTTTTKTYLINVNLPLRQIMEEILENAHAIFGFEEGTPLELVESGQQNNNLNSEDAPAIELHSPDETFQQRFKNVAFYIRKV
jgi:hypothetical protein